MRPSAPNFETVIRRRIHTGTYSISDFWKLQPRWNSPCSDHVSLPFCATARQHITKKSSELRWFIAPFGMEIRALQSFGSAGPALLFFELRRCGRCGPCSLRFAPIRRSDTWQKTITALSWFSLQQMTNMTPILKNARRSHRCQQRRVLGRNDE